MKQKVKAAQILSRPQVDLALLMDAVQDLRTLIGDSLPDYLEQAEIQVKYDGYIRKEQELANKMMRLDDVLIPAEFDFRKISSLSSEATEKLTKQKPANLGQASRISGVSPSDISILMVFMGR